VLHSSLRRLRPDVRVVGNHLPPRMKAFEVIAQDGTVFYSKLTQGTLPNMPALVAKIVAHYPSDPPSTSPSPDSLSSQNVLIRQVIVHPPTDAALSAAAETLVEDVHALQAKKARTHRWLRIIGASIVAAGIIGGAAKFFWDRRNEQPQQRQADVRIARATAPLS
jgi:hypothetical protein